MWALVFITCNGDTSTSLLASGPIKSTGHFVAPYDPTAPHIQYSYGKTSSLTGNKAIL